MKEVRWMLASDSQWLKEHVAAAYPEKLMVLDSPPPVFSDEFILPNPSFS